jgi:hypothetical protein
VRVLAVDWQGEGGAAVVLPAVGEAGVPGTDVVPEQAEEEPQQGAVEEAETQPKEEVLPGFR